MRTMTFSDWQRWGEAEAWATNAAINHGNKMLMECEARLKAEGLSWPQIRDHAEYAAICERRDALSRWFNQQIEFVREAA